MTRLFKLIAWRCHGNIVIFLALTVVSSMSSDCSSNPCMYGICVDDQISSYRCYCIDGYTGINCEINWDDCWSNPCLNGATCNDAIASYNCTCPDGYVGLNCEQKYSECMNQPCLNNGTCLDYNGFTCQCLDGFSGEFCEIDESVCNNTICKNNGECFEGPGLTFGCRCTDGWTGKVCEEDVNECTASPCQNGGLCINEPGTYKCACLFGFTGKDCDKRIIPCEESPCKNNAVCLFEDGQSVCYCVPDYHGTFCELRYDDCASKNAHCQNGGTCVDGINDFTCSCPPRYTGDTCDTPRILPTTESTDQTTFGQSVPTDSTASTSEPSTSTNNQSTTIWLDVESTEAAAVAALPTTTSESSTTRATTTSESSTTRAPTTSESSTTRAQTSMTVVPPVVESRTENELDFPTIVTEVPSLDLTTEPTTTGFEETTFAVFTTDTIGHVYSVQTPVDAGGAITTPPTTMVAIKTTSIAASVNDSTILPYTTGWTSNAGYSEGLSEPSATTLASAVRTDSSRPEDADYDETITSHYLGSFSPTGTDQTTPVNIRPVVSMLPSTIVPSSSDGMLPIVTDAAPTTTTTTTMTTTTEAQVDFTTVTEFHRSTFGSDMITDRGETTITTTAPNRTLDTVYTCTKEQCVNTTLCLRNATQCDCSYRNNCRWQLADSSVRNAAFNGRSYIRQKFAIDDGVLSIFVRLKTKSKSGILIHALFDDERYVLLYIESGQLKFQFSCGLQTMLFGELDTPINNGFDVDIEMRFRYIVEESSDRCSARLLVNGTVAMSGEQILNTHDTVPQFARLHLGGIPVAFSHQFPQILLGFVGCMSLLKVNELKRDFIKDSVEAVQIEECDSFLCLSNPCKNFGACQEVEGKVKCKCFAGYSGESCERSICDDNPCHLGATCLISPGINFLCICPLGTHGMFCEKDTTVVQPSFSVFSPGFSSYMAYGVSTSLKDHMELRLRIIPQMQEQISLIAYMGQSGSKRDSSDHFSLTYVRGYVMLTWDLGSGVRRIFTDSPLNMKSHKVHTLRIGRRGRDAWLYVEGIGNVTGKTAGTNTRLDVSPILYIGGHKSKYFETLPHDLPLHAGFSGCIYDIELRTDDNVFPITMSSPATGRGVGECHRNECSYHSCKNGAVCLNYGPTYSCICMKEWVGPDCSTMVNCTSSNSLCHK